MKSKLLYSALCILNLVALPACQPGSPQVGSQTNWLMICSSSDDCGDLECICGACTLSCSEDDTCSSRGLGTCRAADDSAAIAACDGRAPHGGFCLASCAEEGCPSGAACVAGVCLAALTETAHVEVDDTVRHQALIGFGASLSYDERAIVDHPQKEALFDAMFEESGFDVVRIRNAYEPDSADDNEVIDLVAEIISAAAVRLGRTPTLFLQSGSPPASLKVNGERFCANSDVDCTLVRDAEGAYDYAGYAAYWRAALEAYEAADLHPDFVSVQNHPDWVSPDEVAIEACRFLPEEGTTTVTLPDGSEVQASFPGYAEALAAVKSASSDLADYVFAAAETAGPPLVGDFSGALTTDDYGALAFNLYGIDPDDVDRAALASVADLAASVNKPVLQTEMQENGLGTAILAHHTLVDANASAYLQLQFVGATSDDDSTVLIGIEDDAVSPLPAFHALRHFARFTDPGWQRVDARSDSETLLSSAWLSPDQTSLTLVFVNPSSTAIDARLTVPTAFDEPLSRARMTRTVFDGVERSVDLGAPSERLVRVPGHSAITVALSRD